MSSYSGGEFDRFLRSCLEGAVARSEPPQGMWDSIVGQVLASRHGPPESPPREGLAHVLRHQLLALERHFFSVPAQYQRISDNRMAVFLQVMAYPSTGCIPLAFI